MFQLVPVFLGLFDSTVQKLMNGFRDIFYELAYSNLSNMLSDLNEKVGTISTELSTAPDRRYVCNDQLSDHLRTGDLG